MKRALVVTLDCDLHPSRVNDIYAAIRLLPGVAVIATLDSMTRETLDLLRWWKLRPLRNPRRGATASGCGACRQSRLDHARDAGPLADATGASGTEAT